MTDQEILELQEKHTQILAECQVKLSSITAIAITATQKETEINALNAKLQELKGQAEAGTMSITALLQEATNLKNQIDQNFSKSSETIAALAAKQSELDAHYNSFLVKPSESEPSKLEKVNSVYQKVMENGDSTDKVNAKMKELEQTLFGDKDKSIVGIKDLILGYESEIKAKKGDWEAKYTALIEKIESLLPGATSTGLAKAYQDQALKYQNPYWVWSTVFITITLGMIAFAVGSLHDSTTISDAIIRIISRLPFFVPAIWLAIFASKQQSQNRRLQEEYAYKESLSKSYEGYKREIEKLPASAEKNKMIEKLLGAMVTMAEYNPSQTLQMRQHNDRPPILADIFKRNSKPEPENK